MVSLIVRTACLMRRVSFRFRFRIIIIICSGTAYWSFGVKNCGGVGDKTRIYRLCTNKSNGGRRRFLREREFGVVVQQTSVRVFLGVRSTVCNFRSRFFFSCRSRCVKMLA